MCIRCNYFGASLSLRRGATCWLGVRRSFRSSARNELRQATSTPKARPIQRNSSIREKARGRNFTTRGNSTDQPVQISLRSLYNEAIPTAVMFAAALAARQTESDQGQTHDHITDRADEGRARQEKWRGCNPGAHGYVEEAHRPGDLGHGSNRDEDHQAAENVIAEVERRLGPEYERREHQQHAKRRADDQGPGK